MNGIGMIREEKKEWKGMQAVLSTLLDNLGDSSFWTVISWSPDLRMKSPG